MTAETANDIHRGNKQMNNTTKMTKTELQTQFEAMNAQDHADLKTRLVKLAEGDRSKPSPKTIEGYALRAYTTK
jgi:hypothetical protein